MRIDVTVKWIIVLLFLSVLVLQAKVQYESRINKEYGSKISGQQVEQCLTTHNNARAAVDVPPLQWSNALAAYAQQWADHLAVSGCKMEHRPRSGTWKQLYGENLFMGSAGYFDVADAVTFWESEKMDYKGKLTIKNFAQVGHYTQMVWKTTTHVGCGIAVCGDQVIIVCNYNPAGNMLGETPY